MVKSKVQGRPMPTVRSEIGPYRRPVERNFALPRSNVRQTNKGTKVPWPTQKAADPCEPFGN